jgi:hypothetical protein
MARYIDADKLIEKYERLMKEPWNKTSAPPSWAIAWDCVIADIDDVPTADVVPKSEVEKWVDRCKDWHEIGELKCKEIERLHGILLQFTDIVHKWGAKNNIDTSEISLVPILQEEADSIIKKANQELAREIFKEIQSCLVRRHWNGFDIVTFEFDAVKYAELKKKYTEGEDKPASEEKYFSPEDVRKMTNQEVREKYSAIRKSMEMW